MQAHRECCECQYFYSHTGVWEFACRRHGGPDAFLLLNPGAKAQRDQVASAWRGDWLDGFCAHLARELAKGEGR